MFVEMTFAALIGYAMAIIIVEKREQWPATSVRPAIQFILRRIHKRMPEMLDCTICTSFWTTLFADIAIWAYSGFEYITTWPLSGLLAVGISWTIIQLFNAIDPPQ